MPAGRRLFQVPPLRPQPATESVRLNRSSPLTRDMMSCFVGSSPNIDIATGCPWDYAPYLTDGGLTNQYGRHHWYGDGAYYVASKLNRYDTFKNLAKWTIGLIFTPNATAGSNRYFAGVVDNPATVSAHDRQIGFYDNVPYAYAYNSNEYYANAPGGAFTVGIPEVLLATITDGGDLRIYRKGKGYADVSPGAVGYSGYFNAYFAVGVGSSTAFANHQGWVALAFYVQRGYSEREAQSFLDNPYQIVEQKRVFFSIPNASAVVTNKIAALALTRTRQPTRLLRVNYANPLARGLTFAAVGDSTFDLTGNYGPSDKKDVEGINRFGLAPAVDSNRTFRNSKTQSDVSRTLLLQVKNQPTSGSGPMLIQAGAGGVGGWGVFIASTNQHLGWVDYGIAGYGSTGAPATIFPSALCSAQAVVRRDRGANNDLRVYNDAGTMVDQVSAGAYNAGSYPINLTYGRCALILLWERALSDDEIAQISANPWQVFEPERLFAALFPVVTVGGAQLLRPSSDITSGWQSSTGGSHYAVVDEVAADDGDYLYTEDLGAVDEVAVSVGSDPSSSTGHVLRYRARSDYAQSVLISLYQGTTLIAQWTDALAAGFALYEHTLSGAEADSITDYTALRVRLTSLS